MEKRAKLEVKIEIDDWVESMCSNSCNFIHIDFDPSGTVEGDWCMLFDEHLKKVSSPKPILTKNTSKRCAKCLALKFED